MFHNMFYRLMHVVIRHNHEASLHVILSDFKLLSQFIQHWRSRNTKEGHSSATGVVLKVLGCLRLQVRRALAVVCERVCGCVVVVMSSCVPARVWLAVRCRPLPCRRSPCFTIT
jgi:hypothetical protein